MKPILSVVTGTLNREQHIANLIQQIRVMAQPLKFEMIVVDGGSEDGTLRWLRLQKDVILIEQGAALGATQAFDGGFRRARGKYVCNLNDDATIIGDIFGAAVKQLEDDPSIGQVVIPFRDPQEPRAKYDVVGVGSPSHITIYGNFAVTRHWLGNKLGWWRPDLYHYYGGDSHLSVSILDAGYRVVRLSGDGSVEHLRIEDKTRHSENTDSRKFYSHWVNWGGPPSSPKIFEDE